MIENAHVRVGGDMVRLVDDDRFELVRVVRGEALGGGAAYRCDAGHEDVGKLRGSSPPLVNVDDQVGVGRGHLGGRLVDELLAMGEHERLGRPGRRRRKAPKQLRKDDGLARSDGKRNGLPSYPTFKGRQTRLQALGLVRPQHRHPRQRFVTSQR